MNKKSGTLASLLLLVASAQPSFGQGAPSLDRQIEELATYEYYGNHAALIPQLGEDDVLGALDAHFEAMHEMVRGASTPAVYRFGAGRTLRAMKILGHVEKIPQWSDEFLNAGFRECGGFASCSSLIQDLAELADISPEGVLRAIETAIRPVVTELPEVSREGRRILLYRLDSLKVLAEFYVTSGIHLPSSLGKSPLLDSRKLEAIRAELSRLESEFAVLRSVGPGESVESASAIETTRLGNMSLNLYLERMNRRALEIWFPGLRDRVRISAVSAEVVRAMALRFAQFESFLPYRAEWVTLLEALPAHADEPGRDLEETEKLRSLLSIRQAEIRAHLAAQGFTPRLIENLIRSEKVLGKKYVMFQSLYHRLGLLASAQRKLVAASIEAKETPEELREARVALDHDIAVGEWLTLGCYAESLIPAEQMSRAALKIGFSDGGTYRLSEACTGTDNQDPEQAVIQYLSGKRVSKIMNPAYLQFGVDLAMIPVLVGSSGVGGLVAAPLEASLSRIAISWSARFAMGRLGTAVMTSVIPKLAATLAGSIVYTALKRTSQAAFKLDPKQFYDPAKSLYGNYAADLIFGSVFSFFTPYPVALGEKFGKAVVANPVLVANPMIAKAAVLVVQVGTESVFFTSVPYLQRTLARFLHTSQDPIIRGWEDFARNVGVSTAISFAFRSRLVVSRR